MPKEIKVIMVFYVSLSQSILQCYGIDIVNKKIQTKMSSRVAYNCNEIVRENECSRGFYICIIQSFNSKRWGVLFPSKYCCKASAF